MVTKYLEQPAVQTILLSKDIRRGDLPASLGETELSTAEDIVQVMQPMKSATVALCHGKEPTLSVVGSLYHHLLNVTSEENRHDKSRVMRDMRRAIHDDLSNRYADQSLLQKSSALDPRIKGLQFLSDADKLSLFAEIAIEAAGLPEVAIKEEPLEIDDQSLPQLPALDSPDLSIEPNEEKDAAVSVQEHTGRSLAKRPKIESDVKGENVL